MKANSEQLIAIEHSGGVLLEAGAGSGKTAVLVKHIFYLIEKKVSESTHLTPEELKEEIRKYLSSIVMMTFTNKASGEMSLRLRRDLDILISQWDENKICYWVLVKEVLDSLNVLTIDGFCARLLKEGYVPEVGNQFDIIDSFKYFKKIEQLFHSWYEKEKELNHSDYFKFVFKDTDSLIKTMVKVFSSAEIRTQWKNSSPKTIVAVDWDQFINEYAKITGHDFILSDPAFSDAFSRFE